MRGAVSQWPSLPRPSFRFRREALTYPARSRLSRRPFFESVVDLEFKLLKADIYESVILAQARATCKHDLQDIEDPAERFIAIEAIIYQSNAKTLQNLTLQRSRTQRDLEKRIKQFQAMRADREVVELAQRNMAVESMKTADPHPSVGSVFSKDYLLARMLFEKSLEEKDKNKRDLKLAIFDRTWGCRSLNFRP